MTDPNDDLKREVYEEGYEDLTGESWDGDDDEELYNTVDSLEDDGWDVEVVG